MKAKLLLSMLSRDTYCGNGEEGMTRCCRATHVVYAAFRDFFFQEVIRMFQCDNETKNTVLADAEVRDKATGLFFIGVLRDMTKDGRSSLWRVGG